MKIVLNLTKGGWHWIATANGKLAQGSSPSLLAAMLRARQELGVIALVEGDPEPTLFHEPLVQHITNVLEPPAQGEVHHIMAGGFVADADNVVPISLAFRRDR